MIFHLPPCSGPPMPPADSAPAVSAPPPGAALQPARTSLQGRLLSVALRGFVKRSLTTQNLADLPAMRDRLDRRTDRMPFPATVTRRGGHLGGLPVEWTRAEAPPTGIAHAGANRG